MVDGEKKDVLENEFELIKKAVNDDQAFEILYNYYFPKIYGYLFKRTGNREVAEDLMSETFLKVFSNLKKFSQKEGYFKAWIYRIATNKLIDHYRKSGKRKDLDLEKFENVLESEEKSPEEKFIVLENQEMVNIILRKMPKRYSEILYFKFFAEMDGGEISEILKISINNVRVLTFRALKNFNKIYDKQKK
ncbi:RNA polymerase sigma factor [bacterium]|nr:RNA polymerase sigma factor [bacterium]